EQGIVRPERVPGAVLGEETRQGLGNRHVPHAARRLQRTHTLAHGDSPLDQPHVPTPQPLRLPNSQSREGQGGEQRPPLPRRGAFEIPQLLSREPALPARRLPLPGQLQSWNGKVALLRAPATKRR